MKLTSQQELALTLLTKNGPVVPGRDRFAAWKGAGLLKALRQLEGKGLVEIEETQDGPRYTAVRDA